jgi:hypothetical protein
MPQQARSAPTAVPVRLTMRTIISSYSLSQGILSVQSLYALAADSCLAAWNGMGPVSAGRRF